MNQNCGILTSQNLVHEAKRILSQIGENDAKIVIRSLQNHNNEIYVIIFDLISSTMRISERWDKDLVTTNRTFIFVAEQQSAGRGQGQNTWKSPFGNIYLTILTKTQNFEILPVINMLIFLGISQALKKYGVEVKFKWANDVFAKEKKLGGVLIKTNIMNNIMYLEIGIGINIVEVQLSTAISIQEIIGKFEDLKLEKDKLIDQITLEIIKIMKNYDRQIVTKTINSKLMYLNEHVKIMSSDLNHVLDEGIFIGLDQNCFAILEIMPEKIKKVIHNGRMISANHK